MTYSKNWVTWIAIITMGICPGCYFRNGKIYSYDELQAIGEPQLHPNCKCFLQQMEAIKAGQATKLGMNGADWWIKYLQKLPDYYITREEAKALGWRKKKGNFAQAAPGYMLFGGEYRNKDNILPRKAGRIWYETDLNYTDGYRTNDRLMFSNDGLIFVTYDHYHTFAEIIGEE